VIRWLGVRLKPPSKRRAAPRHEDACSRLLFLFSLFPPFSYLSTHRSPDRRESRDDLRVHPKF